MIFWIEQIVLMISMSLWVGTLPPGSLFFQAMSRLFWVIIFIMGMAFMVHSSKLFWVASQDATLGVLVGLMVRMLFRRDAGLLFANTLIPLVISVEKYFFTLMQQMVGQSSEKPNNQSLERVLLKLPSWVNRYGFDRRLQFGYRFFMRRFAEVVDVLFSLHYLSQQLESRFEFDLFQDELNECVSSIQVLFLLILSKLRFELGDLKVPDVSEKLIILEHKIRKYIPAGLDDQVDHESWLIFADVVCCLEDLRWLLLKLIESLNPQINMSQSVVPLGLPHLENNDQPPTQTMTHHKEHD